TQDVHRPRRALDVPTREPLAPRRGPLERAVVTGFLPQGEVGRVALLGVDLDLLPVARTQRLQRVAGELAVPGERRDVEVDGPVDHVRVALLDQPFDD